MKIPHKILASLVALLAAGLLQAADSKPVARVMVTSDIETDDPASYAAWQSQENAIIKAKLGIETHFHVFVTAFDGVKSGTVRGVYTAESMAALAKINAFVASDPALREIGERFRAIRKFGPRVLSQGIRFDGTYPGSYVYTTTMRVTDEAAYLKALDGLRALFDAKGFLDAKINAYRVLAGRTNYSHRVSIGVPTNDRLAALLDLLGTDAQLSVWLADVAKYRTVVTSTTAHDITK